MSSGPRNDDGGGRLREWLGEWTGGLVLGAVVLVLGAYETVTTEVFNGSRSDLVIVATMTAIAVALCRRAPAAALAIAWVLAALHLVSGVQPMFVEIFLVAVMFGTARWGRAATVVAGGMSIPLVVAAGVATLVGQGYDTFSASPLGQRVGDLFYASSTGGLATSLAAAGTVLAAPWLAGLTIRFALRARDSRASQERAEEQTAVAVRETEQAREIARLRDEQARLARDVHDVVGHSLAVILAQAESAQYLPDDPAALKQTMATIAGSARSSLQDVRQVLSAPDHPVATRPLDTLVDGVRAGGHEVVVRELGTARPLPPELEVTAYRVLQEMLTNAVRHGRRDEPVFVERHWPDDSLSDELRVEVRNGIEGAGETTDRRGSGLDGMRQRLGAVGGRLDVRRRDEDDATTTFTVTAWIPLGPR
ncbi:sensor histidine kinase [Nocardioides sp.]|uniref:sensor histidine kinase n=1 Tax=Nocardioides sp. TaxID=35761 RepID=UPI00271F3AF4|nr:histidine kinase [Nocardioides sp.]MDO9458163.1 histidine kinase [Nocardioides sp.]